MLNEDSYLCFPRKRSHRGFRGCSTSKILLSNKSRVSVTVIEIETKENRDLEQICCLFSVLFRFRHLKTLNINVSNSGSKLGLSSREGAQFYEKTLGRRNLRGMRSGRSGTTGDNLDFDFRLTSPLLTFCFAKRHDFK